MNLYFLPLYKNAAKIAKCLLSILQPTTRGLSCLDTANILILTLGNTLFNAIYTCCVLTLCVSSLALQRVLILNKVIQRKQWRPIP